MVAPTILMALLFSGLVSGAEPGLAREMLRRGNRLYGDGKYGEAVNKYNEALVEQPQALEPKFNKANGYYRLDDLGEAIDLYQEVAVESKDMALVTKAKYNLGNCFFQQGSKQRDSQPHKAIEDMETSISYWRQVLDLDPKNERAARNIEVARLTIKDIRDRLKPPPDQEDRQNQHDPNQPSQEDQDKQDDQPQPQQDPNQPGDPNQPQPQPKPSQDPNQTEDQPQPEPQPQEQKMTPDATAQEILDREQRLKKEREIEQRGRYPGVERDW